MQFCMPRCYSLDVILPRNVDFQKKKTSSTQRSVLSKLALALEVFKNSNLRSLKLDLRAFVMKFVVLAESMELWALLQIIIYRDTAIGNSWQAK